MLRVVIVDDERLARQGLRQLLADVSGVTVVGEADCVRMAGELIAREKPDAVFLDIQMPGADGFSLLESLEVRPAIVFVTAHAEHAARAFDVEAVDYLLKPVRPERLEAAVRRVRSGLGDGQGFSEGYQPGDRICFRTPQRTIVVPLAAVAALEADGDFTRIHLPGIPPLMICHPLGAYEKVLPAPLFLRLDRSLIVNADRILGSERRSRDAANLLIAGVSVPFSLGRTAQARLKEYLAGRAAG
jgi:two-component system LytT family response regulator